jgi:hypothetical protein
MDLLETAGTRIFIKEVTGSHVPLRHFRNGCALPHLGHGFLYAVDILEVPSEPRILFWTNRKHASRRFVLRYGGRIHSVVVTSSALLTLDTALN